MRNGHIVLACMSSVLSIYIYICVRNRMGPGENREVIGVMDLNDRVWISIKIAFWHTFPVGVPSEPSQIILARHPDKLNIRGWDTRASKIWKRGMDWVWILW